MLRHLDAVLLGEVYAAARDLYSGYEQPHQPRIRPRCLCARCAVVAAAEQLDLSPTQRREALYLLQLGAKAKYALTVADLAASDPATVLDLYASILTQLWLFAPEDEDDGNDDSPSGDALVDDDDDPVDRQPWPPEQPAALLAELPFVTSGGLALDPAADRLYLPIEGGSALAVVDTAHLTPVAVVPLGVSGESWEPTATVLNPRTKRAYVIHSNYDRGTLSVVDCVENAVIATVALDAAPTDLAVDPANHRLYVAQHDAEQVTILDSDSLQALRVVSFNTTVGAVRVDPGASRIFVAEDREGTIHVLDGGSGEQLARVDLDSPVFDLALDPAAARLYAVGGDLNGDFGDWVVTGYHVVDTAAGRLERQVRTAYTPMHVAAGPGRLALGHASYPGVAFVDVGADVPMAAWRTPGAVVGLAVHPTAPHIYALGLTNLWVLAASGED